MANDSSDRNALINIDVDLSTVNFEEHPNLMPVGIRFLGAQINDLKSENAVTQMALKNALSHLHDVKRQNDGISHDVSSLRENMIDLKQHSIS